MTPMTWSFLTQLPTGYPRVRATFGYDLVTLWWVGTATSEHIFLDRIRRTLYEFDRHDESMPLIRVWH